MADSTPAYSRRSPKHLRLPRKWEEVLSFGGKYLNTYGLLGIAALLIAGLVWEGIVESGKWLWFRIGSALFMIAIAIANFATLHRRE